ncbi:MAG TPA: DMT family transporter [Trueperaceae bacterium]
MARSSTNLVVGLLIALASASAFGSSGALAKGLLAAGWTPAAAVVWRVTLGALALLVPAGLAMRGRWPALGRGWRSVVLFGLVAVAGCQLAYFQAVERLSVAVALLLEFSGGILLVVLWLWVRRGRRPRRLTLVGSAIALIGLTLVVDVFGALDVDVIGVLWGLAAALGMAAYFVISEDESHGLPTIAVAAGGLLVGAVVLLLAGAFGVIDIVWQPTEVLLAGWSVPWWAGVLALSLFAAAFAYGSGVAAVRRLGSKLASFVGLSEVLFAVGWAWLLLAEVPAPVQLLGGAFIVVGAVVVRLDSEQAVGADATTGPVPEVAVGD